MDEQQIKTIFDTSLVEYFNRGVEEKRFVDVSRIPLICQDISTIHKRIEKIDDNMTWIVRIIVGAVILGLLTTLFK